MRLGFHKYLPILTVIGAVLLVAAPAFAQQSGSNSSQQSSNQTQPSKPPADDNGFPEDVSKKAADAAAQQKKAEQQSPQQSIQPAQDQAKPADDNPFPEETSRKAAADAKAAASSSGVSSSSDYDERVNGGRDAVEPNAAMPHVHTKLQTQQDLDVGTYYLQSGNYVAAYARFKEAATLHPENADAMFGLAEAARHLKKNDEAMENYRLYLDVVPSGGKSRDARKGIAMLEKSH
jgi:tetratricopeptide (TPR) repeat protein